MLRKIGFNSVINSELLWHNHWQSIQIKLKHKYDGRMAREVEKLEKKRRVGRIVQGKKTVKEVKRRVYRLRTSMMTFVEEESRLKRKTEVNETGSLSN